MNHAVRISEPEMKELRKAAQINSRSIAGQAEHWMRIGRAVERDPGVAYSRIERALRGLQPLDLDSLGADEQEAFLDRFEDAALAPTPAQRAFYAEMKRKGGIVGMDKDGNLIEQAPAAGA